MRQVNRALLLAGVAMLMPLAPAMAQEEAANVIVVTSTKDRDASLLDYAGSAVVIDAQALEARQFQDLTSLSYAAPNVSLDTVGTFKGVANFAIRGLGINSSIPSIDPAVGLFVDGVYQGINAGSVFDMFDVEQVEVLRGPQGVSFGQNVTGGAVMVRTADPSQQWEGHARLSYEGPVDSNRGTGMFSSRAVVSGPLTEQLSFRLGVLHSDDGGYFENQFDGGEYGAARTTLLRGGLAFRSGGLELIAKGEWMESKGEGATTHNNGQFARDDFRLSVNERGFNDSENTAFTLRGELEVGSGMLTNIFAVRSYDQATRNDIDSSPASLFNSDTTVSQDQWSNELTYAVETGPARIVAGSFLLGQELGYDESRDLSGLGAAPQFGGGRQQHDVYGLFGQVDFDVSEALSLKAGLRWSREEKDAQVTYVRTRPQCSVIAATCPFTGERVAGENNGFADKRSWENFSPRFVATFKASDDARIYASWARGFRSGGYNFRITQPDAFEEVTGALGSPAFDREQVDTFELGAKWQSADELVFVQGALFWSEVDNLQREVILPSTTSGFAQSIYNTANARIKGLELEATIAPVTGLSLGSNIGLTEAEYREVFFDLSGDNVIDAADFALELPRAPQWTYGASANYEVALGTTTSLSASLFYQHRDRFAYSDNNWGFNSASDRVDARISLTCGECNVTLSLYGRNLLDELQFGADGGLPFAGGSFSDGDNEPFDPSPNAGTFSPAQKGRVLGVELAAQF